jgi:hypothetical protein
MRVPIYARGGAGQAWATAGLLRRGQLKSHDRNIWCAFNLDTEGTNLQNQLNRKPNICCTSLSFIWAQPCCGLERWDNISVSIPCAISQNEAVGRCIFPLSPTTAALRATSIGEFLNIQETIPLCGPPLLFMGSSLTISWRGTSPYTVSAGTTTFGK